MSVRLSWIGMWLLLSLAAAVGGCSGDDDGSGGATATPTTMPTNTPTTGPTNTPTTGSTNTPTTTPTNTSTTAPSATPTATPTAQQQLCAVTPGAWSAPDWTTNAAVALALRAQLDTLVGSTMRGAEQGTVVIGGVSQLVDLYEAGNPSLADVTTAGYDAVVDDIFADFVALLAAGPGDPIDDNGMWTPGTDGGIFGDSARGLNAGGLEVRQLADKGLFGGAALYNYAVGLTTGTIHAGTIDALAAAWGTNETLDPAGDLTDSANYSHQMGFHAEIASALTQAKAFAADNNCTTERDEALRAFFRTWEQSLLARTIFYANEASGAVAAATTDSEFVGALHELGEGSGLTLGFRGVPDPTSGPLAGDAVVITDAQIDDIMAALGVDPANLNDSTTGLFVEDPAAFAAAVLAVEEIVAEVYDLDEADIESYREPVEG